MRVVIVFILRKLNYLENIIYMLKEYSFEDCQNEVSVFKQVSVYHVETLFERLCCQNVRNTNKTTLFFMSYVLIMKYH